MFITFWTLNGVIACLLKRCVNISRRMQKTKWKQCLKNRKLLTGRAFFAYLVAIRKVMVTNAGHVINKVVTWSRENLSWNIRSAGKKQKKNKFNVSGGTVSCKSNRIVFGYRRSYLYFYISGGGWFMLTLYSVHSNTYTVIHQPSQHSSPPLTAFTSADTYNEYYYTDNWGCF